MNILLTARDSFVSKTILKHLGEKYAYTIDSFTHSELDLRDINKLREILDSKTYTWVINPAISGQGRLLKEDSFEDFYNNALITENLLFCKEKYNFNLVCFSSGAGNNRNKDIKNLKEGEFLEPPLSKYSLSKYLMNRRVFNLDGITNLRIFNLFGEFEKDTRFIKTLLNKYINKEKEIEIWNDVYMDFFGELDFIKVLEYILNNPRPNYFELNLVYFQKYLMSEVCKIVNSFDSHKIETKILDNGVNKHYFGSGYKLAELKIPLNNLEQELRILYWKLKNKNAQK